MGDNSKPRRVSTPTISPVQAEDIFPYRSLRFERKPKITKTPDVSVILENDFELATKPNSETNETHRQNSNSDSAVDIASNGKNKSMSLDSVVVLRGKDEQRSDRASSGSSSKRQSSESISKLKLNRTSSQNLKKDKFEVYDRLALEQVNLANFNRSSVGRHSAGGRIGGIAATPSIGSQVMLNGTNLHRSSSTLHSSPVVREQYWSCKKCCCCLNWTTRERILLWIVIILILVIGALFGIVGVLADKKAKAEERAIDHVG